LGEEGFRIRRVQKGPNTKKGVGGKERKKGRGGGVQNPRSRGEHQKKILILLYLYTVLGKKSVLFRSGKRAERNYISTCFRMKGGGKV